MINRLAPRTAAPITQSILAKGPVVMNDPSLSGRSINGQSQDYDSRLCLAVGFILAVAFHTSSKALITASVPAVADLK
jgi:hypothetical protein